MDASADVSARLVDINEIWPRFTEMPSDDKILVTGATGFIGTRLVGALTGRGRSVRALARRGRPDPPPGLAKDGRGPLDHPLVELFAGDLADRDSLARAVDGCTEVYHLAGYAKNWSPRREVYDELNVRAMLAVLDAARRAGVRRIVWTSSQLTSGPTPPGQLADEAMPRASEICLTDYERSKLEGERRALEAAAQGAPVVIVAPTRVYGPGYLTEGNSVTRLIDMYDRGFVPFLLNFGRNVGNWVLVDDVVAGMILAMERGRPGEKYILGGENTTLRQFFRAIDRATGRRHRQIPIFRFTPLLFAKFQQKRADWFGVYPTITPGWVRTFLSDWPCTSAKAQRELGYRARSLEEGICITWEWLQRVREEVQNAK